MKVLLLRMKRTGGTLTFRDNLISLKNGLQRKEKDWEVVTKLKEIVFVPGSPWDWANEEHQAILIEEHVPNHLTLRIPKIKQVMDIHHHYHLIKTMKPATERFCIIINGDSGTQKTKLA